MRLSSEFVEHAADRILLNEDIWHVIKWALSKMGIPFIEAGRMDKYAVMDITKVSGDTPGGIVERAKKMTLASNERRYVDTVIAKRGDSRVWLYIKRDVRKKDSDKLALGLVKWLAARHGRVLEINDACMEAQVLLEKNRKFWQKKLSTIR